MKGWSNLSSKSRSAIINTLKWWTWSFTFCALNLISFEYKFFLDALHCVNLIVGHILHHVDFAVAASANHFHQFEVTLRHFFLVIAQVDYKTHTQSGEKTRQTYFRFSFSFLYVRSRTTVCLRVLLTFQGRTLSSHSLPCSTYRHNMLYYSPFY